MKYVRNELATLNKKLAEYNSRLVQLKHGATPKPDNEYAIVCWSRDYVQSRINGIMFVLERLNLY